MHTGIKGVQEMKKDLTNSQLDRQNILNNNMALEEIRNTSNIQGVWFEDKVYIFYKKYGGRIFRSRYSNNREVCIC